MTMGSYTSLLCMHYNIPIYRKSICKSVHLSAERCVYIKSLQINGYIIEFKYNYL